MASVATCTAVWNPTVTSVPPRSLSIVFGTPTTRTPSSASWTAAPSVPSPPITIRPSRLCAATVARILSGPSSTRYGLAPEDPRIVPPRGRIPVVSAIPSGWVASSRTPRHPSWNPTNSIPWDRMPRRTTARITAFSPGQSPPPVRTPRRMSPPYRTVPAIPAE